VPALSRRAMSRGSLALALATLSLAPQFAVATSKSSAGSSRLSSEIKGSIAVHDGSHIRLVTDLGNVVIHTQNDGKIEYRAHLETDASQKDAAQLLKGFTMSAHEIPDGVAIKGQALSHSSSGRLWISIELNIPKNCVLDVSSGGGNITADDLSGKTMLSTAGGNITTGNIDAAAHIETAGGHITVGNVGGDLVATTGGGHINAGIIDGNATLHTSGGHIRVHSIRGSAHLGTGGGNVTLEHSGSDLYAETVGGQIEVGEASGLVRAKTGGGGIHVVRVSGPSDLQTVGGSIYLTHVDSAVKAFTGAGGITAWFVAPPKQPGQCELHAGDGDIVVYLPRTLPVTIDAQIELGDDHRVIFDQAFPLKLSYETLPSGARALHAEGSINGGGEVLHLRTVAGNIRVLFSDAAKELEIYNQQMDRLAHQLELSTAQP
jgi:DUF4097 and DUF4098 domain-containing protein YvlB